MRNLRAICGRFYNNSLDWTIDRAIEAISAGALCYLPAVLFLIAVAIVAWRLA